MHVLLVEDNDGDADLVAQALSGPVAESIRVSRVVRLSAAMRMLHETQVDVVLLDLSLPDASGLEALMRVRAEFPNAPVVVLTGLSDASAGMRAMQHGAQDYLQKGVLDSELLRAVRYARERAQIAERAQVLSDISAAIAGARDPQSVLDKLGQTLTKRYSAWFVADGVPAGELSAQEHLAASEPRMAAAGKLFSMLTSLDAQGDYRIRVEELLKEGLSSAMIVPFQAKGWSLGTLTFGRPASADPFLPADLLFGVEVARRVVLAIEYAELLALALSERERAEVAGRARDEFLATLSHELRTPLNAILGWTVMLRAGKVAPDTLPKALETIERNARSQVALIEDILEVSRIITGKIRLEFSTVDVAAVLTSALESIRPTAQAKALSIEVNTDRDVGSVLADPDRLLQIFWNLLSNAVKFTPAGGRVTVDVRRLGESIEIVVADTGQGIPAELIPHVFQRFRQGDSTITRSQGGLGLGLAIVRHLVDLQGGAIKAESEGLGKGAKFTLSLSVAPFLPASAGAMAETQTAQATANVVSALVLSGISILVVDDDDDSRSLVATVLECSGATVSTASSASEGLVRLRDRRPDIVLSDISMPGQSGYDFIAQVRALGASEGGMTPAVALTAYARPDDRARALSLGFDQHVSKPILPDSLVAVLAGLKPSATSAPSVIVAKA